MAHVYGVLFRMKKIYVGNLDFRATEGTLRSFCEQCGVEVHDVKIISDRYTGRSRGFGFVELAESQDLSEAISVLNGKSMDGRSLRVDEAQQRRDDS